MTLVWSPQDPAYPLPTGPHCDLCGTWVRDAVRPLCTACERDELTYHQAHEQEQS